MDIDVEPVEDIADSAVPDGIDAPEYVLYGGKGGVGKTTLAAATALASARDGTPTLVVSTDPAHSLGDTLETEIPASPDRIRTDIPLYAAEIDPETALSAGQFPDGGLGDLFGPGGGLFQGGPGGFGQDSDGNPGRGGSPADTAGPGTGETATEDRSGAGETGVTGAGSMPGADEAAAIRVLVEFFNDSRFDRVVVDTAPTGHTLRLLSLPEMLDSMTGRLLGLRERLGGLFGGGPGDQDGAGETAGVDGLQAFASRIDDLRAVLRDPERTDFRVVLVPEESSVLESERLLDRLDSFGIPVGTVVVNRIMQDPRAVADVDADWLVAPNHADCAFCERRWTVQQRALGRAQDIFRSHDIRRVPLFAEEVRGEKLLRVVAACLAKQ